MMLITKAVAKSLPALYANEDKDPSEITVPLKLFNPCGAATWYITEMNSDTGMMFGLCDLGLGYPELGYVSLDELKSVRLRFGLGIERDRHWDTSVTLREVMDKVGL
jgi:hypothetical protein